MSATNPRKQVLLGLAGEKPVTPENQLPTTAIFGANTFNENTMRERLPKPACVNHSNG